MATDDPRLFHLIHQAHRALFRAADRALQQRFGITTAQQGVLFHLAENDGAQMTDIAAALNLGNSTLTGLIDRMERKGLVERHASSSDGRAFALHLGKPGKDILRRAAPLIRTVNAQLLAGLSAPARRHVTAFLTHVIENAETLVAASAGTPVARLANAKWSKKS